MIAIIASNRPAVGRESGSVPGRQKRRQELTLIAAGERQGRRDRVIDYVQTDSRKPESDTTTSLMSSLIVQHPTARALAPRGQLSILGGTTSTLLRVVTLGTILGILSAKRLVELIYKQDVAELEHLASLCAYSQLSPVVDRIYLLEQIHDAFARFPSGQFAGKIVISIGSAPPT